MRGLGPRYYNGWAKSTNERARGARLTATTSEDVKEMANDGGALAAKGAADDERSSGELDCVGAGSGKASNKPAKKQAKKLEPMWSASFILLLCVNFFQSMGTQFAGTALPLYARDLGGDATMVGLVVSAFAITALAIRPFSGPAFDSFQKKRLYFLAYSLNTISMFLYAFADTTELLFAVRLLHGIGIGTAAPLGMALVSRVVPASRLSSGVSFYMLAFSVAQSVGPAFAVWLAGTFGYFPTFISAGCMLTVALCIIPLVKIAPETNLPPYKIKLDRIFAKQVFVPTGIICLISCAFSCTASFLVIYGTLVGVADIGFYFTVYAVCLLVTRPLFGRLSDQHGAKVILIPAFIAFGISYVIISQATTLPMFLLAAVIGSCGFGICNPLLQALALRMVPADHTGAGTNTTYTGLDVGNLLGPALAGVLVDLFIPLAGSEATAYSWMWLCMVIPIALGLVMYLMMARRMDEGAKQASAVDYEDTKANAR